MRKILSLILIAALVVGCGIKRPLELPGEKKHKTDTQDATLPSNTGSQPAVQDNSQLSPAPSEAPSVPAAPATDGSAPDIGTSAPQANK